VLIDATIAAMFQKNFPAAKDLARKAAQLDPSYFFPRHGGRLGRYRGRKVQ